MAISRILIPAGALCTARMAFSGMTHQELEYVWRIALKISIGIKSQGSACEFALRAHISMKTPKTAQLNARLAHTETQLQRNAWKTAPSPTLGTLLFTSASRPALMADLQTTIRTHAFNRLIATPIQWGIQHHISVWSPRTALSSLTISQTWWPNYASSNALLLCGETRLQKNACLPAHGTLHTILALRIPTPKSVSPNAQSIPSSTLTITLKHVSKTALNLQLSPTLLLPMPFPSAVYKSVLMTSILKTLLIYVFLNANPLPLLSTTTMSIHPAFKIAQKTSTKISPNKSV